jgi:hypothetical protein
VEGGGSEARAAVAVGATSLPVTDASWYAPSGGLVVSGPQRIRYTGKGTVGGPTKPTATPQAVVGNLAAGPYSYTVTQVTSGAEGPLSTPSTPVSLAAVAPPPQTLVATPIVSAVPPPATAPTITPVVTAVPAPTTQTVNTPVSTAVLNPPLEMLDAPYTASGSLTGACDYFWKYEWVTASGKKTLPSPPNNFYAGFWYTDGINSFTYPGCALSRLETSGDARIVARRIYRTKGIPRSGPNPPPAPTADASYFLEATISDNVTTTYNSTKADTALGAALVSGNTTGEGGLVPTAYYAWAVSFVIAGGETTLGPWTGGGGADTMVVSSIPTAADARVIARRIYRATLTGSVWGPMKLDVTINDNTTTSYTSTKTDAQLGAVAPASNTTGTGGLVPGTSYAWDVTFGTSAGETPLGPWTGLIAMPALADTATLTSIPTSGDARVTKRRIYRTGPAGVWQLVTTINDNTTTTYQDVKSDGQLGAAPPTSNTTGSGGLLPGTTYWWTVKFGTASGDSAEMPGIMLALPAGYDTVQLTGIPTSADGRVTKRRIYRTTGNGGIFRLEVDINDNTTTTYTSVKTDASLGADLVFGNTTTGGGQIAVSAIAIGPGGTTARKLYRTESGGAAYKFVTTIADNTTTTYQDNKSDASLGALAPVDVVTELIGIPASGDGSILYEIRMGDEVNILVQCDDVPAQTALAALEGGGSTGIVEHYIQDGRLGLSVATATGNADLKLFSRPLVTIGYATRDPQTRSGKTVTINLPELGLVGDFTIQSVEIDEIDRAPGLFPRYKVTCSSVRFSLEDVIRRLELEP